MKILCNSRVCFIPHLPPHVMDVFNKTFTYRHRKWITGKDAWAKFGKSGGNEFTWKTFVQVSENGFALPGGAVEKAVEILRLSGYDPTVEYRDFYDVTPDWARVKAKVQFRPSQEETLQALTSNYFGGIEASPGYGKSFLIYCMTELFPTSRFDIVSDSTVVCRQLFDYLEPYIPDVGLYGDGSKKKGRVTVYTIDSLHHSSGEAEFLLVDEVHSAVTESASAKYAKYRRARRYWFSATPEGRADNTDCRVENLFGRPRAKFSYQDCVRLGLVVNIEVNWIPIDMPHNPIEGECDRTIQARLAIWRNESRHMQLAQVINSLPEDEQVLVLTSRVEHLCLLAPHLKGMQIAFGHSKNSIGEASTWVPHGKISSDVLEDRKRKNLELRKAFTRGDVKRMLVTSIWDTGANFPELQHIFRTDPFDGGWIKDIQAPGRGSRLGDGTKTCGRLYDAIDRYDNKLYDMARENRSAYKSQGWDEVGWVPKDKPTCYFQPAMSPPV